MTYLKNMTHAVLCRWSGRQPFEVIAAFNCEEAATAYAKRCTENWAGSAVEMQYIVEDIEHE